MKAVSLIQPWATLVAIGAKRIETRGWSTPHRGALAIHVSKKFPKEAQDLVTREPFRTALEKIILGSPEEFSFLKRDMWQLGHVICTTKLDDCVRVDHLPTLSMEERAFGNYEAGRFGWLLSEIKLLPEPVAWQGALSLWDWMPAAGSGQAAQGDLFGGVTGTSRPGHAS